MVCDKRKGKTNRKREAEKKGRKNLNRERKRPKSKREASARPEEAVLQTSTLLLEGYSCVLTSNAVN